MSAITLYARETAGFSDRVANTLALRPRRRTSA